MKFLILMTLLFALVSCSEDKEVQPVDLSEANPQFKELKKEVQQMKEEAARARQEIEEQINEAQEEIEERSRQMEVESRLAQLEITRAQRNVAFDLMLTKQKEDPKKIELALRYFALMEFQINDNSTENQRLSVEQFLRDVEKLWPKKLKLKYSMRKDDSFNLYILSLAMGSLNPARDTGSETFLDVVANGLNRNNVDEVGLLVRQNRGRLEYLMQLRHNALYDSVLAAFGALSFRLFGNHKITGEGMDLETASRLLTMLRQADRVRELLESLGIEILEYNKRRKKLKDLELEIHEDVPRQVSHVLTDLHRHIQENY